jgi:hypothetical protein
MGLKLKISPMVAFFMIGVALIYDGIQFLLSFIFMGWLMSIWSQMTFWFWFSYLGVSFTKSSKLLGSKIAAMGLPAIMGLIPVLDALPAWTAGVATNIAIVYAEDLLSAITPKTLRSMGNALSKMKKVGSRSVGG